MCKFIYFQLQLMGKKCKSSNIPISPYSIWLENRFFLVYFDMLMIWVVENLIKVMGIIKCSVKNEFGGK